MKKVLRSICKILSHFVPQRVLDKLVLFRFNFLFKKRNPGCKVKLLRTFPLDTVSVGNGTYGPLNVFSLGDESHLVIGRYCSIAEEVTFLLSIDHPVDRLSTSPYLIDFGTKNNVVSKGDIIVGDDVWFGYRSVILSGVSIGRGAVIAAGSIVTRDVPPYSIVAGVPAKIIKSRFSQATIDKLLKIDFGLFRTRVSNELLNSPVNDGNIDNLISLIDEEYGEC